MQKFSDQTSKMLLKTEDQIFDFLVPQDHPFRKLAKVINFEEIVAPLREECYSDLGTTGIDITKGFRALLVQFWEDYSDRQMEKAVKENIASAKARKSPRCSAGDSDSTVPPGFHDYGFTHDCVCQTVRHCYIV